LMTVKVLSTMPILRSSIYLIVLIDVCLMFPALLLYLTLPSPKINHN
jgi:hypothetical protein